MTRDDSREIPSRLGIPWGTRAPRGALTAARLRKGLRSRVVGSAVTALKGASSTNDVAHWLASHGCADGHAVVAESQWAGRGRQGRSWHSPAGSGIWLSIVLRPGWPAGGGQALTFLGAVAAARAVRSLYGVEAGLKWPNDIVVAGRKLGGVLTETEAEGRRIRHAVVGIGINVNQPSGSFPAPIRATATSVRALTGRRIARLGLLRRLLEEADRRYADMMRKGPAALIEEAGRLMPMAGSVVRVRDHARVIEGTVAGLDDDGALMVRPAAGTIVHLHAGEVTVLR